MPEVPIELVTANCKNIKKLSQTKKETDLKDKAFNRNCFYIQEA